MRWRAGLVALVLAGCGATFSGAAGVRPGRAILLDGAQDCRFQNWAPCWTPATSDTEPVEAGLYGYLANSRIVGADIAASRLRTTLVQYLGITREGRRTILANGVCSVEFLDAHRIITVLDGGPCYFQAYWDVEQQAFVALSVNNSF